ncbi:type III-B CRISPR module RAMP protein Cmr1 [Shouchella clausii]|uniref:Type III-B CRISPR module RAMP protein Cmr1 n=1 Tax=Shouchella clausii TaxID=79880 RepID=A0A268P074_SHOCL|nr:type III-B CRISPR module RAMP protein Cmr1 [Shouchella clausii]PAE89153.1 type III-B CRISPR module RAMP protein Cmr1 [Shouchella clausii]
MENKERVTPPLLENVKSQLENYSKKIADHTFKITVVTPMVGGSAQAGKINDSDPIRISAIRGHLRFWWRATRGASFENVYDLRKRESEIFGDTKLPSKVKLWIKYINRSSPTNAKVKELKNGKWRHKIKSEYSDYALFPLNEDNNAKVLIHCKFKLYLQYIDVDKREMDEEILPALWAWINFGGVGARTRRGCGSLYCNHAQFIPSISDQVKTYESWYKYKQQQYKLKLTYEAKEWPTLPPDIIAKNSTGNAIQVWKEVVGTYKNFRSKRPPEGRRSAWPEADAIRHITQMRATKHKTPVPKEKGICIAFPRAEFGMPILFHYKPIGSRDHSREPYTLQLVPEDKNRLASPIITKVMATSEKMGVGIIVRLNQPKPVNLELKIADSEATELEKQRINELISKFPLTQEYIYQQLRYPHNPFMKNKKVSSTNSAIQAFLQSKEVQRWKQGSRTTHSSPKPKKN